MLSIDTSALSKIDSEHGLSDKEMFLDDDTVKTLIAAVKRRDQGFYTVIDDEKSVSDVENFCSAVEGNYDDVVVLGIGGSSLGTICLQQSLTHLFENEKIDRARRRLRVLDNIDPVLMRQILDVIAFERTLFIVVTKSGGTPETLSQYFYFRNLCDEKKLNAKKHFVFVTDPQKGLLRKVGKAEGITMFDVPPNVGGRFSVLTAVGLLPAKLIGIDIRKLLAGARMMRDGFLAESFANNLPLKLAKTQYELGNKGKIMNVLMPYSHKLIRFADWYRQLLAESIGKAKSDAGKTVHTGLTPINALGVTDQHSQSQLYNEGPNDKFFMFIEVKNPNDKIAIPNLFPDEKEVDFINNVDFGTLMRIEMNGTRDSLSHNNRPHVTVSIDAVDESALGELFMLFEGATAFLGELYGINAFDQPGVELSKQLTKKLLLEARK